MNTNIHTATHDPAFTRRAHTDRDYVKHILD